MAGVSPVLSKLILPSQRGVAVTPWLTQSLNFEIKILVQQGKSLRALQLYVSKHCFPRNATNFTFPPLLKACATLKNLFYGETIHATIITLGLQIDPCILTSLINMYVKSGSLNNAVQLFDIVLNNKVLIRDVTIWNSMIDGYFKYGYIEKGLSKFRWMQNLGIKPDVYSLTIVLGGCGDCRAVCVEGQQVHGFIVRNMFVDDPFVATALVDMYSKFNRPMDAWHVFQKLEGKKNVATWNAMIGGFCENGMWECGFELYRLLKHESFPLDSASFLCLLTTCSQGKNTGFGNQLLCDIIKMGLDSDPYLRTSLITMYANCTFVEDAEKVFHSSPDVETEIWNAMISAYVDNGCAYDALKIFNKMRLSAFPSDSFTMSNLLAGCYTSGLFDFGRMLHGELTKRPIQHNIVVQSALLMLYSTCGTIEDAISVFNSMKDKDVVAWGSIISALCQSTKFKEAMDYFGLMRADSVKPDPYIMADVINACKELNNLELSGVIYGFVIKNGFGSDAVVASSLINMYSVCGSQEMVENVFYGIARNNIMVWNSMISFYCRNGVPNQSVNLFPRIIEHGLHPDFVTITSILGAISSMAALLKGKSIHGYRTRLEMSNLQVDNALIEMYIKCGSLKYSERLFHNASQRNLVTWNLMIAGYGSHGKCLQAITLFEEMITTVTKPDDVTFLSLISACNHAGFVGKGLRIFHSMGEHRIEPKMEHYVNVIDLLGRAGCLHDAYSFIQNMPIEPDRNVWLCLLSACRVHSEVVLGEFAAHKLLEMEPSRGCNYVQLLHMYVEGGLRDRAANLRAVMRKEGLKKSPGNSWIEVRDEISTFFSGDTSSPSAIEIYKTLDDLRSNMVKKGGSGELLEAY